MHAYAPPATDVSVPEHIDGRRLELRHIEPVSAGKLLGVLYGTLALVFGGLYGVAIALFSVVGFAAEGDPTALLGLLGAVAVAVMVPVFYGGMGAVAGLIMAAIYNFAAGRVGGLRFELGEV